MATARLTAMTALAMLALGGCSASDSGYDKTLHFMAGAATARFVEQRTGSKLKGCLAALTVGVAKEIYDRRRDRDFSRDDAFATAMGCSITFVF